MRIRKFKIRKIKISKFRLAWNRTSFKIYEFLDKKTKENGAVINCNKRFIVKWVT